MGQEKQEMVRSSHWETFRPQKTANFTFKTTKEKKEKKKGEIRIRIYYSRMGFRKEKFI